MCSLGSGNKWSGVGPRMWSTMSNDTGARLWAIASSMLYRRRCARWIPDRAAVSEGDLNAAMSAIFARKKWLTAEMCWIVVVAAYLRSANNQNTKATKVRTCSWYERCSRYGFGGGPVGVSLCRNPLHVSHRRVYTALDGAWTEFVSSSDAPEYTRCANGDRPDVSRRWMGGG